MEIIKTQTNQEGSTRLGAQIIGYLIAERKVLWLLSGGSNIQASVEIMCKIPAELTGNLTISLIDERYGTVGHPDSNFQQLIDAGFDAKNATLVPVLYEGLTIQQTTEKFAAFLEQALENNDVKIGQLGIGPDGHIAGILPHSVASKDTAALAIYYDGGVFDKDIFSRITTTFTFLRQLGSAYAFAYGENKRTALENLQQDKSLQEQPAQILKAISNAYVYNDNIE